MWEKNRYREFTLDNGLDVALYETDEPIFSGKLVVKSGSNVEEIKGSGVAHFLEHLISVMKHLLMLIL